MKPYQDLKAFYHHELLQELQELQVQKQIMKNFLGYHRLMKIQWVKNSRLNSRMIIKLLRIFLKLN